MTTSAPLQQRNRPPWAGNPAALERKLRHHVEGEVRFDDGSRALYATDASNYRQVPIGVVLPRHAEDIVATVAICREFSAPILSRGGGTSLAGQCCNVAVVMDMSKYMRRIVALDPDRRRARVEPGVVLDDLRVAAERYHLTFGPDPATHNHCTFGGMIGNNSCGVHSVSAGRTVDNIEELEILTYDGHRFRVGATPAADLEGLVTRGGRIGDIYRGLQAIVDTHAPLIRERYPQIPRRVSGYNLDELLPERGFQVARALVGSEGTCVTVLEATCRLVHSPPARALVVMGYPDIYTAGDHVLEILAHQPIGLEGIDDRLVGYMKKKGTHQKAAGLLPEGEGWLLVEFGGDDREQAVEAARRMMADLGRQSSAPNMRLCDNPREEMEVWEVRESGLGATAHVPGLPITWEGWEDSAVPPAKVGPYLRDLRALLDRFEYKCALYGHFGDGCIHTRIDFDLRSRAGIDKYRRFVREAAQLVIGHGGSISGEHGDGQSKAELLPLMFGPELVRAFRDFKRLWDPDWRMNPGKVVEPYANDENLRLGADYNPWKPQTRFGYVADHGDFSTTMLRCVGVGKCRRTEGGTMCPSYMVTREEMHSTRGRAHLLFEMLQGDVIRGGWRNAHVREALDLCLACKGCKADCPVNVDMATYKAEFLSHFYAGRLRPRQAYAMGGIAWAARIASMAPRVANFLTHHPLFAPLARWTAGIASERELPRFADRTFKGWWRRRAPQNPSGPPVILWPDTFNNHFHPQILRAAVEVIEAAGWRVIVPGGFLCCGRPLYDFGMLTVARRLLRRVMGGLRDHLRAGVPLVGLEPSCLSVFRDELLALYPEDEDARRLHDLSMTLGEFLLKRAQFTPPRLNREALVHGHCHHHAILKMEADREILRKAGLRFEMLEAACCGMAGAFGFEKEHYDVSVRCGERVLLPRVRAASEDTLILTDGFSCREQIRQQSPRRAIHTAEFLAMAVREGDPLGPEGHEILPRKTIPELQEQSELEARPVPGGESVGMIGDPRQTRTPTAVDPAKTTTSQANRPA